ncbi:MAG: hypothetical protein ACTSYI_00925 [Promethearchaeota archaeon]
MKKRYLTVGIMVVLVVVGITIPWDIFFPNQDDLEDQDDAEDPGVRDYINYPVSEYFWTNETYTGNVTEYDQFLTLVDNFDYDAELNMSLNDYPYKIANYCSSAVFDEFKVLVQENQENWGGIPNRTSYAEYQVDIKWVSSLNFTCITYYDHTNIALNPEIMVLNETHGSYVGSQEILEDPHWYFNASLLLPDIFSHPTGSSGIFPLEHLIQCSDVYVMSMELSYHWFISGLCAEWHRILQTVILNADRDIMAIFVSDMIPWVS